MNKKKFLSMAIAGALMVSAATAAYANPVTDADDPAYVELTAVADNAKAKGEAVSPAELEKLAVPKADVKLVDKKADAATVALYRYLSAVPKAGKVIYGHENDAHHKMFRPAGGSESDTKDVTGSLSGIVGFDALSFVGDEQRLDDCEWNTGKTYVDKMVEITRKAAGEGAIITMSMHMPNFDLVERRAAVTGSTPENRDHYMNYTTHISEGKRKS
ncbi:MAG: beta-mannosidase, partial [Selenomonadaceae bacterium]|nr:beta-mannosidase [Selenomonadaceae bacterium]